MTIDVRFRLRRAAFRLEVEFSVPSRGITALFGPSGAGKTTLLRAIAGLEPADSAFVRVDGAVWQDDTRALAPYERPIGYVFQDARLFPHLGVRGNLRYGFDRTRRERRRIGFEDAVRWLGIEHLLDRETAGLSGGESQRVAIARALLTSPKLLLLDEPVASLDAAGKAEILPYLERLHEELQIPALYVSHSPDEVARLADHMVLMQAGRALAAGPIADLLTRFDLPLALAPEAESIVAGTIAEQDDLYRLTVVDTSGGRFFVAQKALPIGQPVRLRILARDVSLTLERQTDTSILNVFAAEVEDVATDDSARSVVRLRIGDDRVLAQVTRKSADALGLATGRRLYAQVKTVALLA